jgi:hypothetical protein
MALIALDLPAFDRPAIATSAPASGGNCAGAATLNKNSTWGKRDTETACPVGHLKRVVV